MVSASDAVRAVLSLSLALGASAAHAQSIMRSPSINVAPGSRPSPRAIVPRDRSDHGVRLAWTRGSTRNVAAAATGIGACHPILATRRAAARRSRQRRRMLRQAVTSADAAVGGASAKARRQRRGAAMRRDGVKTRTVANEIVAEIDGALTEAQADALARRHGLRRIALAEFSADRRHHRSVSDHRPPPGGQRSAASSRPMAASARCSRISAICCRTESARPKAIPAQYALAKLRLPEAHTLAHGANVTIAVIDSGIDAQASRTCRLDRRQRSMRSAARKARMSHGTGIAGAIVSHARLMGARRRRTSSRSAPSARRRRTAREHAPMWS